MGRNNYIVKDNYLQILEWFSKKGHWYTISHQINRDRVGRANP